MQITRQSEYAIKILVELAQYPPGELVSSKVISEHQDIPAMFLQKTVQLLTKAGLVTTQRGIQGGVRLAVPADKITIANVINAIEGPVAVNVCLAAGYTCVNQPTCRVRGILARAQAALVRELNRETIADIVAGNINE